MKCFLAPIISVVAVYGADNLDRTAVRTSERPMDYTTLPSDASAHSRTKWSGDVHLLIDDAGAPSLFVFDRSGKRISGTLLQIPGADQLRVTDFAAGPDRTIWASGQAVSRQGQQSFFLARIAPDGSEAQVIQTTPFQVRQLAVAPDSTVWAVGREISKDRSGNWIPLDMAQHVLRHFDGSGRLIASSVALNSVGMARVMSGYLVATRDRVGWYAPANGVGVYAEFGTDMTPIATYPASALAGDHSLTWGFALTQRGNAFLLLAHPKLAASGPALLGLDRTSGEWAIVSGVPTDSRGTFPMLLGSDGESLIFRGPPDKTKLQVLDVRIGQR
jgi:hypothetical protein